MYRPKHEQPRKGLAKYKKSHILLVSILLVMTIGIGSTVAFLMDSTDAVVNLFNPSHVTSEVHEDPFNGTTKTNVTVKNTSDIEAYIRASIIVTWKDFENGAVYGKAPVADTDYTIELNKTDWVKGYDGYYYYKAPVDAGASTNSLIYSCTANDEKTPQGYGLNVEILGSAIQSVPSYVVVDKWAAVDAVNTDGRTLSVITGG